MTIADYKIKDLIKRTKRSINQANKGFPCKPEYIGWELEIKNGMVSLVYHYLDGEAIKSTSHSLLAVLDS